MTHDFWYHFVNGLGEFELLLCVGVLIGAVVGYRRTR